VAPLVALVLVSVQVLVAQSVEEKAELQLVVLWLVHHKRLAKESH